jgi:hypothetical protein
VPVEFDEVDPVQRRVSDLRFEHEAEEVLSGARCVHEQMGVPELIARRLHGAKPSSHGVLAHDWVISRGIQHHDVGS